MRSRSCQISLFPFSEKGELKAQKQREKGKKKFFQFAWNGFFRPHPNKGYAAPDDCLGTLCNGCTKLSQSRITDRPANQVSAAASIKRRRKRIGKAHYSGSWRPFFVTERIIAFRRRSPDCYTAYYHDAAQSSIFVKVQQGVILEYNVSEDNPKGYSCPVSFLNKTSTV